MLRFSESTYAAQLFQAEDPIFGGMATGIVQPCSRIRCRICGHRFPDVLSDRGCGLDVCTWPLLWFSGFRLLLSGSF